MFSESLERLAREAEADLGGRVGVAFEDVAGPVRGHYRGEELFHAASTMKVAVMIEVFRQAEDGCFSLGDSVVLDPIFPSMIDDSPYETDAGRYLKDRVRGTASVHELVEQMIVVSDNLATNLLVTRVRPQAVTATARRLGARQSFVLRCVQDEQAFLAGVSNRFTPNDLNALLRAIVEDRAASPAGCEEMRRILYHQEFRDILVPELPGGVRVGSKSGSITRHRHDCGFVDAPWGRYLVSIMSDGLRDDSTANARLAKLSRAIYDLRAATVTP